jgi:hypothetical protein
MTDNKREKFNMMLALYRQGRNPVRRRNLEKLGRQIIKPKIRTRTEQTNRRNYIQKRAKFQQLLKLFREGKPVSKEELNSTRLALEKLAKKFTGSNVYTPKENMKAIRYINNKQFLNLYRKYKGVENGEIPNNSNYRVLVNYANKVYGTENLNLARNMIVNKMNVPVKKIQNAFRKSRKVEPSNNKVRASKKIFNAFTTYKAKKINLPQTSFLESLKKDGRFGYYVGVLYNLQHRVKLVFEMIKYGEDPHKVISNVIGVCHYTPRPQALVQQVQNIPTVRKWLSMFKKKTPKEYLLAFQKQLLYVSNEYKKMSDSEKQEYRDRLHSELSGRPCLENLLDSLAKALVKQDFVWIGKTKNYQNNPLLQNNIRYIGFGPNLKINGTLKKGLINTAIQSWYTANRPANWNSKNLNARKQIFWNMIKKLPLAMVYQNNIVNGTPNLYNRNGVKFKASILANQLNSM